MKNRWLLFFIHITLVAGLICFLILFYFEIQNILLTYFIIIMSIILLISKLLYWFSIRKTQSRINGFDKQNIFLLRLTICVFTYISPVYCIIQEPFLIVNRYISIVTFLIVTLLAIIGIFIERWLFVKESQQTVYDNNA